MIKILKFLEHKVIVCKCINAKTSQPKNKKNIELNKFSVQN